LLVSNAPGAILWPVLLLLVVSFIDDLRKLTVRARLGFQLIAVILAMGSIHQPIFQGLLPLWLDQIIMGLAWMWFINLYNFMDGIDEMTITQTSVMGMGLMAFGLFVPEVPRHLSIDAVIIIAAIAPFYVLNRHPAKAFMGDTGSVPLGFLMAYLLFSLAAFGHWEAALILPAYYLMDPTLTLLRRMAAGKKIAQPHSEHFYQRAVRAGYSHRSVVRKVLALNLFLVALAVVSIMGGLVALGAIVIAYVATAVLLIHFVSLPSTTLRAGAHAEAA
jgi:UDP-N-acetylmuramyl pentapeptide phosphotransferase/UDP-N-acetylglucosamine-1-phosphate transferase